jgi:hypothetical protein
MNARRMTQSTLLSLTATAGMLLSAAPASARITHEFLPAVTSTLTEGVPASEPEPVITGPLGEANGLTVDEGHVWIAEKDLESTRVDEFGAETGVFEAQLAQAPSLGELDRGVAVGHVTGAREVYAASSGALGVFGPSGDLQDAWTGFSEGGAELNGVAVDNTTGSLTDWAAGDVYVASGVEGGGGLNVVDVFVPLAGGAQPASPVVQLRGTCATPGMSCSTAEQEEHAFVDPTGVSVAQGSGELLVIDAKHVVDVFEPNGLDQFVFVRQITEAGGVPFEEVRAVAGDGGNGDVYVGSEAVQVLAGVVDEFDAVGALVGVISEAPGGPSPGAFRVLNSIGVDPSTHEIYISEYRQAQIGGVINKSTVVDVFGGDLVLPDVVTGAPVEVGSVSAVFNGSVDPLGAGVASCRFVYGEVAAFRQNVACPEVPDGSGPVGRQVTVSGLSSGTEYCYRLESGNTNGLNEGEPGQDQCFLTLGAELTKESVSDVAVTSATFEATVNPREKPTSYYFQYGKTTAYENVLPASPGVPIGEGGGDVEVPSEHVQGLVANTVYHYRVVAVREAILGEPQTFPGPDQTFTTQGGGSTLTLPDARRWELVSPAQKHGALLQNIGNIGVTQAASSGGAITYFANAPTEGGVSGYTDAAQVLSVRAPEGWASQGIALPHASAVGASIGGHEYRWFSKDLSTAIVEQAGPFTSLAPDVFPVATERTPYIRNNSTCNSSPGTCFRPIVTSAPGYADVPQGTVFGGAIEQGSGEAQFLAASEDSEHVILASKVPLTETPTNLLETPLYEWSAVTSPDRQIQPVSVLPESEGGALVAGVLGPTTPITTHANANRAVSADGSRVFWSRANGGLYMRDVAKGRSLRLDVVQSGNGQGVVTPIFQAANPEGSVVLFTDQQELTGSSGPGDLYECAIVEGASGDSCVLSDLTRDSRGAEVQGLVLGGSRDLSSVYFVASGVLSQTANARGEVATLGQPNLYLLRRVGGVWQAPIFVTSLSGDDAPDWGTREMELFSQTARVSSDGRFVVFMSDRSLTGYDNRDVVSQQPDEEVYVYDAASEHLACASCNPTGARPSGEEGKTLEQGPAGAEKIWSPTAWFAADVPGWDTFILGVARYQPRYLSDSGRVFFNSSDALVPQDVNHAEDVYEFEPAGVGSCSASSLTFSSSSGGCVSLISSGTAADDSGFVDASETGDDVFFLTGERLTREDIDTSLDLYDARSCEGGVSCPSEPSSTPPCTTADSCRSAPGAQPSIFGSPSSSTFNGPGNSQSSVAGVKPKPKALSRAQNLAVLLKACRKKRDGHKRAVCERQARKRFPAKRATTTSRRSGR